MPHNHHHCHSKDYKQDSCVNRNFRDCSQILRSKLGNLQFKMCLPKPLENPEELKYKTFNYNGSFHKGLEHSSDGKLTFPEQYECMRDSIINNDQVKLAGVPLAPNAEIKLVNPLSSLATILIGAPQCTLKIDEPPALSSASGGAEMVEVYCKAFLRDVPFEEYNKAVLTDADLILILETPNAYINHPDVLTYLKYKPPGSFNGKNVFRGPTPDELFGPYISQLLYLDIPVGTNRIEQKYTKLLPRYNNRVEWGVTLDEMVLIQNNNISALPGTPAFDTAKRYLYNGRALAEVVHTDPPFQFYYSAALILGVLGASPNPGFPVYPNQVPFITGNNGPNVLCSIAEVAGLALIHAFYQKWRCFRRVRPEAMSIAIHNVKTDPLLNPNNYDLSDVVLQNEILEEIKTINNTWVPASDSYTLPLCYPEGSPTHPSYPAGHATIAGACCTILKIFYDAEKPWNSLPGVTSGSLAQVTGVVEPCPPVYATLKQYTGTDAGSMSIWGEINKLASNVSLGRDWAGVHYRSDGIQGMVLGEQVAIKFMGDKMSAMIENNLDGTVPEITFRKFDGTFETIIPTICKKKCGC